jgi:hypothetical protein
MALEDAGAQRNLLASGAKTVTGTSTGVPGFGPFSKLGAQIVVTAASGTTPTLDAKIQHSIDGGTTWFDLITFTQKTAVSSEFKAYAEVFGTTGQVWGDMLRVSYTIGGTTPSFTFSVDVYAQ